MPFYRITTKRTDARTEKRLKSATHYELESVYRRAKITWKETSGKARNCAFKEEDAQRFVVNENEKMVSDRQDVSMLGPRNKVSSQQL